MNALVEYVASHAERGECQCGKCFDKGPDREAPAHSVNVHFFWVSPKNNPNKEDLARLLKAEYPSLERLKGGPSYIEIGATIGDQGLGLMLIGLGELVGMWKAITPEGLGVTGNAADRMAESGFVMMSGFSAEASA